MPRNISSDIVIKGTNPFVPKTTEKKDQEKSTQGASGAAVLTESEDKQVDKPRLKLPSLTKRTTLSNVYDDENDLQVLLRVRCFDFPLQVHGLKPESTDESETGSPASSLASSVEDHNKTTTEGENYGSDVMKGKKIVLPLSLSTVLEGQRINLQGKEGPIKQRKAREANNVSSQTNSTSQVTGNAKAFNLIPRKSEQQVFSPPPMADKFHVTNTFHVSRSARKSIAERRDSRLSYRTDSRSSIASLKPMMKQRTRPTFHLPKADKYDINPKNVVEVKVCSVFKGNALKTMLIYSGHNDSWNPSRDSRLLKNAVLKALMQQPAMFLRQPSAEDGIKMALKRNDSLLAKATLPCQPVETVDNKVTREVKKFVVRLPPIH